MQRRKFVIGLGALSAGAAAAMGTGAFSSVQAHRGLTVQVADDANAYLAITSDSPYAVVTEDGTLEVDFGSDNENLGVEDGIAGGQGVNQNATTAVLNLFTIKNQGTETVGIQIDRPELPGGASNHVNFFVGEHGGVTLSAYSTEEMAEKLDYDDPDSDPRVLRPGETLPVGLYFLNSAEDVNGNPVDNDWDFDGEFTINALDEGTANHVAGS